MQYSEVVNKEEYEMRAQALPYSFHSRTPLFQRRNKRCALASIVQVSIHSSALSPSLSLEGAEFVVQAEPFHGYGGQQVHPARLDRVLA